MPEPPSKINATGGHVSEGQRAQRHEGAAPEQPTLSTSPKQSYYRPPYAVDGDGDDDLALHVQITKP